MRTRTALPATIIAALALAAPLAQRGGDPIDRIRESDIRRDLFALAGDELRGREGGTLDELTASAWVAERAREAGVLTELEVAAL